MGMLDNLFTVKATINENDQRLIDLVEKIDTTDSVFANIMNDLGSYIDKVGEDEDKLRMMAYAYARRFAAAGLCAQGAWDRDAFDYTYNLFKSFQMNTGQSVEFQKKAAAQAMELIKSYDSRMDEEIHSALVNVFICDSVKIPKEQGVFFSVDQVVDQFKSIKNK